MGITVGVYYFIKFIKLQYAPANLLPLPNPSFLSLLLPKHNNFRIGRIDFDLPYLVTAAPKHGTLFYDLVILIKDSE